MKKTAACLATLLMAGSANAAVTNLFPNGDFDSPSGTKDPWIEVFGGGTTTFSYPTAGGNPGGYGTMANSSGWGIWVGQTSPTEGLPLAPLGLVPGGTYTFVMDTKNFSGTGISTLKIESWAGGAMLSSSGEISAGSQSGSWATYNFTASIDPNATGIMVVPVVGAESVIGYDNIGVIVPNSPLTASVTAPGEGAVVSPNFLINATASVAPGTVTNVNFYNGGTLLGNDTTAPYSYSVTGLSPGAHALKVVAWDNSGNSATSPVVNITVSNVVSGWQLVWSDEFNGPGIDASTWVFENGNGNGGWGNNERQFYTGRTNNASVLGGVLRIIARQESTNGFPYTSARMKTQGRFSKKYGRIEFRTKLPAGVGCWPANWMMPETSAYGGWAASGEIDVMESRGSDSTKVEGTIHYGGSWPDNVYSGTSYVFPNGGTATDFHTYMVEWSTNSLKWYVDGVLYQTQTNWFSAGYPYPAPFDQPFYLIMNLAIGGNYLGNPSDAAINSGTPFPVEMQVDYVRVYDYVAGPPGTPTGLTASPGDAEVYLTWDDLGVGATGYAIKRATNSGGPYTTVGTAAVNSYTDATVANCSTYYYVVSATNSIGVSPESSEQAASLGAFALAVNSGGGASGHFTADANVTGGTIGAMSPAIIDTTGLIAPAPQAVYRAERYGNFTYTFTGLIPGANYKVRLHSAETYWTAVGQRRFSVAINGAQVLTNFDIIAVAGAPNKAVISEFNAVATNGQIAVQYTTVTDNARSSGIEILLPQPAAPTAGNNGPLWQGMTLNLTASTVPGATYHWSGPNGFSATNQNPSIANATTNDSGLFSVTAITDACTSSPTTSTLVTINPPASVNIQPGADGIILSWPGGLLQSATNVLGPWNDVSGATSPRTNPAAAAQEFYRLKLQ